uniref:polymeric immunoglobulin receptor-like n=1 Tax=Semicossyphus pulcher TaxID=241346 RepID=UPI0037E7A2C4
MKTFSVIACLLYATWTVKADLMVEGFEGGEVSFQCSHSFASNNKKYLCKNSCKVIGDILLREGSGGRAVSERITLADSGNGVLTVTFSQLQLRDSGRYWCGVERSGVDTFNAVHLTVNEETPRVWTACKLGVMGANWRTTTTVILTLLQIPALISVKTTAGGVEGQSFEFRCDYPEHLKSNGKFFCHVDDDTCSNYLIQTDKQNQWVTQGRYSVYDNNTGGFFTVGVDKLTLEDSGMYWCGVDISSRPDHIHVIQLNVSRVTVSPPTVSTKAPTVDKLNLPLYLTAVMCVAAILCVCMFTLCLLMAVKQRRSGTLHSRQASSDYETMAPGVSTEPEPYCTCSDCADLSSFPPQPPDLCAHFTSKQRESTVTLGPGEYVDVDVSGHICQYQHLDLTRLEDHVYHCINGNNSAKDGLLGVKEHIIG